MGSQFEYFFALLFAAVPCPAPLAGVAGVCAGGLAPVAVSSLPAVTSSFQLKMLSHMAASSATAGGRDGTRFVHANLCFCGDECNKMAAADLVIARAVTLARRAMSMNHVAYTAAQSGLKHRW